MRPELTYYGWHSYTSGSLSALAVLTVAHLAPADQGEYPYKALCGAGASGRGAKRDRSSTVKWELRRGERTLCKRCEKAAAKLGLELPS